MPSSFSLRAFVASSWNSFSPNGWLLLIFKSWLKWHFLRGAFHDHPFKSMIPYHTLSQHLVLFVECVTICNYFIYGFPCFLSYSLNYKLPEVWGLTILSIFWSVTPSTGPGPQEVLIKYVLNGWMNKNLFTSLHLLPVHEIKNSMRVAALFYCQHLHPQNLVLCLAHSEYPIDICWIKIKSKKLGKICTSSQAERWKREWKVENTGHALLLGRPPCTGFVFPRHY